MLDLEVQSAYQPRYHLVLRGEIGCGLDLVDGPLVFHLACLYIRYREGGMLDGMRQLEDHAEHKTRHTGEDDKADQPVLKTKHVNRQAHKKKGVEQLETPEHEVVRKAHFLQGHISYPALEIFLVIQH